jgi:holo-[acyl-carrier protein] synthase
VLARPDNVRIRIGVDIVDVDRLRRLVTEYEGRRDELFTPTELAYCNRKRRPYEHLASRFAAKEAVLKAFGTGLVQRMRWTDVEVVNEPGGKPGIRLHGEVAEVAARRGLNDLDVSISQTGALAVAQAIAVWERPTGVAACAST